MLLHNLRFNSSKSMEQRSAWSGMSPACVVPRINKRLWLWLRWQCSGAARWRYSAGLMRCDTWVPSSGSGPCFLPWPPSEAPRLVGTVLHRSIPLLTSHHHHSTSHSVRTISWGKHLRWQYFFSKCTSVLMTEFCLE